jgi:hypothetical protein
MEEFRTQMARAQSVRVAAEALNAAIEKAAAHGVRTTVEVFELESARTPVTTVSVKTTVDV